MAPRAQVLSEPLAMIALDLDHAVLQGAAGAAEPLHLGEARLERGAALRQAVDHGHGLAVAAAAIPEEPDHAVARGGRLRGWLHGRNLAESSRRGPGCLGAGGAS